MLLFQEKSIGAIENMGSLRDIAVNLLQPSTLIIKKFYMLVNPFATSLIGGY